MLIALYTSRVLLATLGFTDHGLYNLVGSVVVMFNMFSATFIAATQRFLNFELGKNNKERVTKVFSASINIHLILALAILVLLETLGLWLLNNSLNIPGDRVLAANVVYQTSVLSFIINLLGIPFNAAIISYERMDVFAYVGMYEAVSKLVIVYLLLLISGDRLILYGILMFLISLSITTFYIWFCKKHFRDCKYKKVNDRTLYKEIVGLSGWSFLSSSATVITVSGMGVVINFFTNVVVNSAKGIAAQVEALVKQLVDNFMASLRPQLTKSYASGDTDYLLSLVSRGTRFSFFLMMALCFPIIFDVDYILKLWLSDVPPYTGAFVQMTLVYIMIMPFSNILDNVIMASGRIKQSQIQLSILQILNLPLSCLILYLGYPPYLIYISYISISYMSLVVRLYQTIKNSELTFDYYIHNVVIPITLVLLISVTLSLIYTSTVSFRKEYITFLLDSLFIEITIIISVCLLGLQKQERDYFLNIIKTIIKRLD